MALQDELLRKLLDQEDEEYLPGKYIPPGETAPVRPLLPASLEDLVAPSAPAARPLEPTFTPRELPPNLAPQSSGGGSLADIAKMAIGLDSTQSPRYNQLNAMRNIQEGLGNVRAVTPGELQLGLQRAPFEATDIRAAMGREQDMIPEEERKALNGFLGREVIPKGMGYKRLEKFFPSMARASDMNDPLSILRAQATMMNAQTNAGRLGLQEQLGPANLALREQSVGQQGERVGLAREGLAVRKELADRPTPAATTRIEDLDTIAENTIQLKNEYMSNPEVQKRIGPISGRWNKFLTGLGIGDPEFTVFSANVENVIANNLYALSGKQINESERADLRRTVFETMQNNESFEALLDNYLVRIRTKRDAVLNVQEATGRNVEKLRGMAPGGASSSASNPGATPGSGTVTFEVDGKRGTVSAEKWPAVQAKYPNAKLVK